MAICEIQSVAEGMGHDEGWIWGEVLRGKEGWWEGGEGEGQGQRQGVKMEGGGAWRRTEDCGGDCKW